MPKVKQVGLQTRVVMRSMRSVQCMVDLARYQDSAYKIASVILTSMNLSKLRNVSIKTSIGFEETVDSHFPQCNMLSKKK